MASKSAAVLACALLLASRSAHADPSAAQKETARTLMAEGRELRERQDLKAALQRFQAADAIMGVPTTGFELARAQVDLELLVEARATLRRVFALPVQDGEPPPFQEARVKADALDADLEARIPSLRLVVEGLAPGETATVSVDGEVIAPAALAMPYRIDPGHHLISAKTTSSSAEKELDVAERESSDVRLVLQRNAVGAVSPGSAQQRSGRIPTLAYVAGGIGAAGLIVGGVSGLLALSAKSSAQDSCQNQRCPPSSWSDLDRAETLATVSTVGFVVGAVGAGIAVGSLLFGKDDEPPVQAFVSVSPSASSLSLTGRF